MKKNSKMIKIGVIIFLIILFISLTLVFLNNRDKKENNNSNNPNNDANNNQVQNNVISISTFDISDFQVQKNTPNKINMVFKLINKSETTISNKTLDINMYQNNKIIYTYHYLIQDLKVSEYIYIQANASFNYQKIDKFEFVIDESKVSIEPTYLD